MSKWGEVIKVDALVMDSILVFPDLPINENPFKKCCYKNLVLADPVDPDTFKNDTKGVLKSFPKSYTAVMELEKYTSGAWAKVADLNTDALGTYYAQGFATKGNNDLIGYSISWQAVLLAHSTGKYRVKFDLSTIELYSEEFCLEVFSTRAADQTVRIDYKLDSVIGSEFSQSTRDFAGIDWWTQIRLNDAIFGYKKGPIEVEASRYQDGFERTVGKEYNEEYLLIIKRLPFALHDLLVYDILQADEIKITDYNSRNNSGSYINKEVEITGSYEPNYRGTRQQPSVELTFKDRYTNRKKLYS